MTDAEIMALAGRELDAAVEINLFRERYLQNGGHDSPHYSADIAAAWKMEQEIERRGLHFEYGRILSETVCASMPANAHSYFLAHASPEMRCKAALLTLREAKGESK